jgi:16S rRNA (guanine1207-N2)-methyltransferase
VRHYFLDDPDLRDEERTFAYYCGAHRLVFTSSSGVFSKDHADDATDVLIKTILRSEKTAPGLALLDLGCGVGLVGVTLGFAFRCAVTLSDCNPRALAYAKKNAAANGVPATAVLSDGFAALPGNYDLIALNPPIHAGKAVTRRLFTEAAAHLSPSGAFYAVMLDKHGAASARKELTDIFGVCEVTLREKGMNVFCCRHNAAKKG